MNPEETAESSKYESFEAFWSFYLSEHTVPGSRALHYAGLALGVFLLIYAYSG